MFIILFPERVNDIRFLVFLFFLLLLFLVLFLQLLLFLPVPCSSPLPRSFSLFLCLIHVPFFYLPFTSIMFIRPNQIEVVSRFYFLLMAKLSLFLYIVFYFMHFCLFILPFFTFPILLMVVFPLFIYMLLFLYLLLVCVTSLFSPFTLLLLHCSSASLPFSSFWCLPQTTISFSCSITLIHFSSHFRVAKKSRDSCGGSMALFVFPHLITSITGLCNPPATLYLFHVLPVSEFSFQSWIFLRSFILLTLYLFFGGG